MQHKYIIHKWSTQGGELHIFVLIHSTVDMQKGKQSESWSDGSLDPHSFQNKVYSLNPISFKMAKTQYTLGISENNMT